MVQCFYLTPSGFEFVKELHFLNLEKPPVSDAIRESDFTTWLSTLHAALNLDICCNVLTGSTKSIWGLGLCSGTKL